jgi:hypothetical protein
MTGVLAIANGSLVDGSEEGLMKCPRPADQAAAAHPAGTFSDRLTASGSFR